MTCWKPVGTYRSRRTRPPVVLIFSNLQLPFSGFLFVSSHFECDLEDFTMCVVRVKKQKRERAGGSEKVGVRRVYESRTPQHSPTPPQPSMQDARDARRILLHHEVRCQLHTIFFYSCTAYYQRLKLKKTPQGLFCPQNARRRKRMGVGDREIGRKRLVRFTPHWAHRPDEAFRVRV